MLILHFWALDNPHGRVGVRVPTEAEIHPRTRFFHASTISLKISSKLFVIFQPG